MRQRAEAREKIAAAPGGTAQQTERWGSGWIPLRQIVTGKDSGNPWDFKLCRIGERIGRGRGTDSGAGAVVGTVAVLFVAGIPWRHFAALAGHSA